MSSINIRAGELVAKSRKKLHMSQAELAKALDVTRTSVSNIERGKQAMSLSMFCRAAEALHVAPHLLLEQVMQSSSHATLTEDDVPESWLRDMLNNSFMINGQQGKAFIVRGDDEQKKN